MEALKAVVFDLDNTLVDFEVAVVRGGEFVQALGLDPQQFLKETHDLWEKFVAGEISWGAAELLRWKTMGVRAELVAQYNHRYEQILRNCPLLPGTEGLLSRLAAQDVKLGLLTNGPSAGQREKIANRGLEGCFGYIGIAEETGHFKPDPEAFQLAAAGLGVACEECVMVGDSLFHDAQGAVLAGFGLAIWFHTEDLAAGAEMNRIREARSIAELKYSLRDCLS